LAGVVAFDSSVFSRHKSHPLSLFAMQALLAALHALVDSQPRSDYRQSYLTGLHAQQQPDYAYTTTATADVMLSLLMRGAFSLYRLCDSFLTYVGVSLLLMHLV